MKKKFLLCILHFFLMILLTLGVQSQNIKNQNIIILSCKEDNDLYMILKENKIACVRYNTPVEAINYASKGTGVLILADDYPEKTTQIDATLYEKARSKKLRLYIEYPSYLPGVAIGA